MTDTFETITITDLAYGSAGIGRPVSGPRAGKVIFVDGVVPGDTVTVEVTQEKKSFARAKLISVVEPSSERVTPPCPVCNECGGCPWMQVAYGAQQTYKRNTIVSELARALGIEKDEAESFVAPTRASKRELGFRNKLEMGARMEGGRGAQGAQGAQGAGGNQGGTVAADRGASRASAKSKFQLGFYARASHDLVCPKRCLVGARGIEKAPGALRGALSFLSNSQPLNIYRVGVRHSLRTHDTEIALWTPPGAFPRKAVARVVESALPATSVVRVMAHPGKARAIKGVEALSGKGYWTEELAGFTYKISAPSFFQVNTAQAETMIKLVLDYAQVDETSLVADLYCGAGTFTLPLAATGATVVGVESAGSSVRDLRRNAHEADLDIDIIGGDATRELPALGNLDVLVVDPPRAGLMPEIIGSIAATNAQRVVYVSCDPATWARDVARLQEVGYDLQEATPVDLFPQSYHIETVSLLQKR